MTETSTRLIRVMIIENNPVMRMGLFCFMSEEPTLKVVAGTTCGESAMAYLRISTVDVVLLNLALPRMSGIEVTQLIKARHPGINVVVFSALENEPDIPKALRAGANACCRHDTSPAQLIKTLKSVHAGNNIAHLRQSLQKSRVLHINPDHQEMKKQGPQSL